ncbi:cytochrome c oxidase subunit II [Spirulina sp. CS-785/01]|uniref:cytochrome c oxidase subunit II n=1 Tax=Spirulina sp. CS-785/01 TaxID=3021716 RepID=UPI00232BF5C9|nr:cytochrome c oxidase subunit II [Spirulina sp. CS-785/01]MDB9315777.1 cytochrome c oxidase subunit II [Spirulina sp. CS-785/01]
MAQEKETVPSSLITLTVGLLVAGISVWYGQNNGLLPEQISKQAPLVDNLFDLMVTIGTALFLLVEGAIVFALIKFRRRKGDETDSPHIKGNFPLEVFWTAIPAFIVIGLGIYSVQLYSEMGGFDNVKKAVASNPAESIVELASASRSDINPLLLAQGNSIINRYGIGGNPDTAKTLPDLEVNVKGIQYAWLFNYPDSGITAGELHIPVNEDIKLNIEAEDVIHSFWLPQFRIKQDAIPGETTQLRFTATETGTYPVVCAELCGAYHGAMRTNIVIHTQEEYAQWVEDNKIARSPDFEQTVAATSQPVDDGEFMKPYVKDLGIDAESLKALQ